MDATNLNSELAVALAEARVVILVYTLAEYDWQYCIYECGLATEPGTSATRVVVLQCGDAFPQTFADSVRVKASEPDDVTKLVRALLTTDNFFPGHPAVTDFTPDHPAVSEAAEALYGSLCERLRTQGPSDEWPTWPTLSLELEGAAVAAYVEAMRDHPFAERNAAARELLLSEAKIIDATSGAAMLFGRTELPANTSLRSLSDWWQMHQPGREAGWLDTISAQFVIGIERRKSSSIDWNAYDEPGGDGRHLPGASTVRFGPGRDKTHVVFHFYALPPRQPATSVMARVQHIQRVDIDRQDPGDVRLVDLLEDLEANNRHRIPVLAAGNRPRYIVHTSMVDRFIRRRAVAGEPVTDLTLADLLDDDALRDMFASTFVVVPASASLAEANRRMHEVGGCQDAFVTEDGTTESPVLGWLTDRDIVEALGKQL